MSDTYDGWITDYEKKRLKAEERVKNGELSQSDCDLCGECLDEDIGEMYGEPKPRHGMQGNELIEVGLVHAQCGIDAGWEIA